MEKCRVDGEHEDRNEHMIFVLNFKKLKSLHPKINVILIVYLFFQYTSIIGVPRILVNTK